MQEQSKQPLISVITICYNAAAGIERTIQSVLGQTYRNIEYIIIDGGSSDGTVDIIKKYEDRFEYWVSEPDKGIYDAMNKGIKHAEGEWLNMMNAGDNFADKDVLKNIFIAEIPEEKVFIYSDMLSCLKNGQTYISQMSFEKGHLIHQCVIYRKRLHEEHGYYIVTKKLIISDYLFSFVFRKKEL